MMSFRRLPFLRNRGRHVIRPDRQLIPRWAIPALVALTVLVLGLGALQSGNQATTTAQLTTAQQAGTAAASTANSLAAQLDAACATGDIPSRYAAACSKARAVVAAPVPGPEGPAGAAGADGATGPAGPVGATGAVGATGVPGTPGVAGATGPQGIPGVAGADGAPGAAGANGADGAPGRDGRDGLNGCDAGQHHDTDGSCVANATDGT